MNDAAGVPSGPHTGDRSRANFLIKLLDAGRPMQIADIGARLTGGAGAPYDLLMRLGAAELSAFEPDADALAQLQAAELINTRVFPYAVGKPGPATFYSHQIGTLSSIYRIKETAASYLGKNFWARRKIEEIPMELVSLDTIADFPRLDLLKMDAQGAELDILQGAKAALSDAVVVIPEVRFYQMYHDEPMWADVDSELRGQGFVLHRFMHQKSVCLPGSQKRRFNVRRNYSQLLDGDAVYIRDLETWDKLSDVQLKMMALCADAVFKSHDLVAYLLDRLAERGAVPKNAARAYVDRVPEDILGPMPDKGAVAAEDDDADGTSDA